MKVKKGDEVVVLAGKDVGRRGTITRVINGADKVIVDGVNMAKRHTKANPSKNTKGGIIEQPMPLKFGKVMVVCNHCGKPTRIGRRTNEDTKERVCKRCGEAIVIEEKA